MRMHVQLVVALCLRPLERVCTHLRLQNAGRSRSMSAPLPPRQPPSSPQGRARRERFAAAARHLCRRARGACCACTNIEQHRQPACYSPTQLTPWAGAQGQLQRRRTDRTSCATPGRETCSSVRQPHSDSRTHHALDTRPDTCGRAHTYKNLSCMRVSHT